MSKIGKDYLDEDFFISNEGNDLFLMHSSERVKHICVTDEADEIGIINESSSLNNSERLIEIVLGIGDNIPLWYQNTTLKWRFNQLFDTYLNSENVKDNIRLLLSEAISSWGDASPVGFEESHIEYDFEIVMRPDKCNSFGCTLASAFFPNSNQNQLALYPKMFTQNRNEQVETLVHELGHVFGLRHYFAKDKESAWRSEVFGHHAPLTIMNYGSQSTLTQQDKDDLKRFYKLAWEGKIENINGLKIKFYNSFTKSSR